MLNDPEAVAGMDDRPPGQWAPPVTEWDTIAMLLAEIRDRQGDVINAIFSTIEVPKGKARPKYKDKPFPRPRTAMDRAREEKSQRARMQILRTFAPHALN